MPVAAARPDWPEGNLILSAVPPEERDRLRPHLELTSLHTRQPLYAAGERLAHLHFPLDCVVATFGVSRGGATARYALIGNEGLVGLNALLGDQRAVGSAVVQSAGWCSRVPAGPLAEAFARDAALRRVMLRYASSLVLHASQNNLCNAHHSVEQRFCFWLLQTLDRVAGTELRITHELVATVLGVRREAVTLAAHRLQARGAIRCQRGRIAVLERRLLESLCCECYGLLKGDIELLAADIQGRRFSNGSQAR